MNVALQSCLGDCPYTVHITYYIQKYPPKTTMEPFKCEYAKKLWTLSKMNAQPWNSSKFFFIFRQVLRLQFIQKSQIQ